MRGSAGVMVGLLVIFTTTVWAGAPVDLPGVHQQRGPTGETRTVCVLEKVGGGLDTRSFEVTDRAGSGSRIAGELWRVEDWDGSYGAIAEDVQISGNGQRIVTGWNLNYERISLFPIESDTPLWEYPLADASTFVDGPVRVAISDDGLSVLGGAGRMQSNAPGGSLFSRVFRFSTSAVPDWTFDLPTGPVVSHLVDAALSGDGSMAAALGIDDDSAMAQVWILDGVSGAFLHMWDIDMAESGSVYNIDFTADGSRLVVGCRNLIKVYDIPGGLQQTITLAYDCQCPAKITPDGAFIAVGNLRGRLTVYRLEVTDGIDQYVEHWSYTIPPDDYYPWIQTVDLSADNSRVVAGSYQPNLEGNHGYLYFFDIDGTKPQWASEDSGGLVEAVAVSTNGTVACAGSWGDLDGAMGWCCVIARDNGHRFTLSSADYGGSLFSADIDDAGFFAVGGSKRVHAYEMGSGGHTFAFYSGVKVETVLIDLSSTPVSGTLPFAVEMSASCRNLTNGPRSADGRVDVLTASGLLVSGLRDGVVDVDSGQLVVIHWRQKIPEAGSLVGDNTFILTAQDVTAAPYNQPPYYPAGDKDMATTVVTGIYQPDHRDDGK